MNHRCSAITLYALMLVPSLGSGSIKSQQATKQHQVQAISVVGIGENGDTEFRGTFVFFGSGRNLTCAYNFVNGDRRGNLSASANPGFCLQGVSKHNKLKDQILRFSVDPYTWIADGLYDIEWDQRTSSGAWTFSTGYGVPDRGTCVIWELELDESTPVDNAEALIAHWTSQLENEHEVIPDDEESVNPNP